MEDVKSIHTLNARGNVMLEVVKDYFGLSSSRMFHEIQGMRREVETLLARKGISYDALKTALVPDRKRREIALVFDSTEVGDHWYGYPIFERLIPLFDESSNNSILVGDYIGDNEHQRALYEAMAESLIVQRSVDYKHSTQFHVVYINNLTPTMMKRLDDGLAAWRPYVGYADTIKIQIPALGHASELGHQAWNDDNSRS
jgi:hypothetical protein